MGDPDIAASLLDGGLVWLRDTYHSHHFYVERDLVWTLQKHLVHSVQSDRPNLRVFNDYPVMPGSHRGLSADLAILDGQGRVLLAAEFKYEPSHSRADIQRQKLPVVFWGTEGVAKDIARVREFVESGRCSSAYSIFVDEGRHFRHRQPHPGSAWFDWANGVSILCSVAGASALSSMATGGDAA